ncbi:MAG: 30S ribosomal protein S5 [Rickettsiaceae bacterium]|nr:30S ribosomal protein S5 [Rickettsiaceae bacterium]
MSENTNNISEDLVHVNRVTKVNKGGRTFSFSATVIVGDENGRVGYGSGKAKEVTEARTKATKDARNNMITVPLYQGRTIHHDVVGKQGAAKVLLRRAAPGTGVIAGGPLRSIFGRLGIEDIVAKSLGSSNSNTMIAATFDALQRLSSPKNIAHRRGKNVTELSVNSNSESK